MAHRAKSLPIHPRPCPPRPPDPAQRRGESRQLVLHAVHLEPSSSNSNFGIPLCQNAASAHDITFRCSQAWPRADNLFDKQQDYPSLTRPPLSARAPTPSQRGPIILSRARRLYYSLVLILTLAGTFIAAFWNKLTIPCSRASANHIHTDHDASLRVSLPGTAHGSRLCCCPASRRPPPRTPPPARRDRGGLDSRPDRHRLRP